MSSRCWLAMTLGLFGTYGKNETVDVHFRQGRPRHLDAEILAD